MKMAVTDRNELNTWSIPQVLQEPDITGTENGNGVVSANDNAASGLVDVDAYPVQPGEFATSTPELDGSIYHVVQSNETLWSIAVNYNRTVADIQALNGLEGNDVTAGQRLLIFYGGTPVADTATPTLTPLPVTNTPKPTSTATATLPPLDTLTPTVTMTSTPEPLIRHISFFDTPGARPFGLTLTIVCAIGLVVTLYLGFFRKP